MEKRKLLLLAGVAFCAALIFAQTLPPTVPSKHEGGLRMESRTEVARRAFQLQGAEYLSTMSLGQAKSGHSWEPSSPLPLSLDQAEEIARKELRKLVSDEIRWQFAEFSISRLHGADGPIWYFAMTLKPVPAMGEVTSDFFTVLINASGESGPIGHLQRAKKP